MKTKEESNKLIESLARDLADHGTFHVRVSSGELKATKRAIIKYLLISSGGSIVQIMKAIRDFEDPNWV